MTNEEKKKLNAQYGADAAKVDTDSSYPGQEEQDDLYADDQNDTLALTSDTFAKINLARDIQGGGKGYCTMQAEDKKSKARLFNACSSPVKLSDCINIPLDIIHFYVEVIQCANKESGELVNVPRVVLIDMKGKGYQAVSVGIYNSVKRIVAMFGHPSTWTEPVRVVTKNVDLGAGQHTYNLEIVED